VRSISSRHVGPRAWPGAATPTAAGVDRRRSGVKDGLRTEPLRGICGGIIVSSSRLPQLQNWVEESGKKRAKRSSKVTAWTRSSRFLRIYCCRTNLRRSFLRALDCGQPAGSNGWCNEVLNHDPDTRGHPEILPSLQGGPRPPLSNRHGPPEACPATFSCSVASKP